MMEQIRSCPFCGGRGRVSFKDARFAGQNYRGDKKIVYRVQIICNRCASRGKPIRTEPMINPRPYNSAWGHHMKRNPLYAKGRRSFLRPTSNRLFVHGMRGM